MTRLHVPVRLRWSDLDAYGHVNNVEVFRLLEEARITVFWRHGEPGSVQEWPTAVLDSGPQADSHTFVARQEIEYLRPLGYARVPVTVQLWIGHIGGASLEVCYEIVDRDPAQDAAPATPPTTMQAAAAAAEAATTRAPAPQPYARASTTIVVVDAATGSPRRLTPTERAAWEPYVEQPVTFRRRGA